jgi:hypothetical protein
MYRPGGCCQQPSSAASFIAKFTNSILRSIRKMRLNTIALECGLSKMKITALLSIRNDPPKPLFDKGLQDGPLPVG